MAQYNTFEDVKDNEDFKSFIKERFGIDDVAKIPEIQKQGMFYMFKSVKNDLTDNDIDYINDKFKSDVRDKDETLKIVAQDSFGKEVEKLSSDETVFAMATAVERTKGDGTLANDRPQWDKDHSLKNENINDGSASGLVDILNGVQENASKREEKSEKQPAVNTALAMDVPHFNNTEEMIAAFYDLVQAKDGAEDFSFKDDVSDDKLLAFIYGRDEYISSHESEKEYIEKQTYGFMDEDSKKRLDEISAIKPSYKTVLEEKTVPNLVNIVTEHGFNDEEVMNRLKNRLADEHLVGQPREMYEAVFAAYQSVHEANGQQAVYHKDVEKLNDLINTPENVKIAEQIAKDFGFESNKEWPEMKKDIEIQVIVTPPTNGGNDGNGGDDGKVFVTPPTNDGNDGDEGNGGGGAGGGDGNGGNDGDDGNGGGGTGGGFQEFEEIRREVRIRSHDNYDNSTLMYQVELDILSDMREQSRNGKEKSEEDKQLDADFAKAKEILASSIRERDLLRGLPEGMEPVQTVSAEDMAWARDFVENTRDKMIAEKDIANYKFRLADYIFAKAVLGDRQKYYTLLTPELTATAIEGYQSQLKDDKLKKAEPGSEEEKQKLNIEIKLKDTLEYGNALVTWLKDKKEFYLTDITNAADEYDGYMHLIDVCEKDDVAKKQQLAKENGTKEEVKADPSYQTARDMMEGYVKPYDETFNIPSGENPKDTAIKMTTRMRDATKVCDELEFNEDTLGKDYLQAMRNYRFVESYNPDGSAQYEECIKTNDETGKLEVVKGSRLDTALRFAANETMMEDLGNFGVKLTKDHLLEGTKDRAFETLFAYANSEEVVKKGLQEDPNKFTDPRYVEEFKQKLMQGETVDVSPLAHDLALKRQANNVETYTNRLVNKLGRANADYLRAGLIRQVQKIDGTSNNVKDNTAAIKKKAVLRNLGNAALTFGVSTAFAYVGTKLSLGSWLGLSSTKAATAGIAGSFKAGGVKGVALAAKAELAIGGVSAAVGAVAGGAVATLTYLGVKKLAAKAKGQKYGWKEIKQDWKNGAFKTAVVAGMLGGASVGFAISGCPTCATICAVSSMGVAGAARAIRSYKDMRVSGHNVLNSALMGGLNFAAAPLGGHVGHQLGMQGVNSHETQVASHDEAKELYGKNGENLDQAKKDGWQFEQSDVRKDHDFHLLDTSSSKSGPYHTYTSDEHGWALKRNDGIRWSEFLNNGKGGYHVQPDYQNGLGGLNHDAALHKNAIDALDSLAGQKGNEWMNTLVDNKAVPNSEMLLYKVYQMRVLAPHENTMLADGSGTVSDFFNADKTHTITTLYEKLLSGKTLDSTDLSVLSKIEDHVGGQITFDETGKVVLNDMGKIRDVVGATHPHPTPVDSYNDTADKGYDLTFKDVTKNLFGKFTRVIDHVTGFGALLAEIPHKVKDRLRPGAKADRDVVVVDRKPKDKIIPPVIIDDDGKKKKDYIKPEITVKEEKQDLLIDEYKLVHGLNGKSMDVQPTSMVMYKDLVMKEWKAEHEAGTTKTENLNDYLLERRARFDAAVALAKAPALEDTKGYSSTKDGLEATNHIRNEMSLTNLAYQGKELPVEKITLKQMTEFTPYSLSNGAGHSEITAARRSHDGPLPKGKSDKPMDGIFDIATGKTSGATKVTTNAGKGTNDGPQVIHKDGGRYK